MEYFIGDFSKLTDLDIHTLRYYEQITQLQKHKNKLDEKIEFYRKEIECVNNTNL